jgi:hypothetical protein
MPLEAARIVLVSSAVPQIIVAQAAGNLIPPAGSTIDDPASLATPAAADGDPDLSSVQAPVPGSATPAQILSDATVAESPSDDARTSAAGANSPFSDMKGQNIEPSLGFPRSMPSLGAKQPALPQSLSGTGPTEKPDAPAPISPSAHAPENSITPRFAAEPRGTLPTPATSRAATEPANSSAGSSAVPLPSPAPSGNPAGGRNSSLTSNSGNQFSAAHTPSGSAPSEGAAQAVTATSPAENNSQSGNPGDNPPDASPHKTTAPAATSTVIAPTVALPPASGSSVGASPADPAMQPAMPPATTAGTALGTPRPANTPGSAQPPGADSLSHMPGSADLPVRPSTGPVQMAQMVNQAAQSEMRIGINTAAFGNVEVRTIVHANDVGVQIGSEKGDLRSLLANELPGIATSLQQQDLRLNQVNFHQTGFAFSNQMSSGGDAQPRSFSCRPRAAATQPADLFRAESTEPSATSSAGGAAGLSILA